MRGSLTFLSVLFTAVVFGHTRDTADILGGISDTQGAAIAGASVTLTSIGTGQVRKVAARVDLIGTGNPVLPTGRSKGNKVDAYFDKTRFRNPAPNTLGTLGRNILEGPGFANLDVSMVKGFRLPMLGESGLGQFRFEAFNAFNRTNFGQPITGITNSSFGKLTGTDGNPRILQLAIKIAF